MTIDNLERAENIIEELTEGRSIGVAFAKQFWVTGTVRHGNLTDRYGIRWMVNVEE